MNTQLSLGNIFAELKGEASNRDAISFRMGMYVCIFTDCAMQFYACVCISATLAQYNPMLVYVCPSHFAQSSGQNVPPRDNYGPGLLPGLCDLYLMEEHDHKRFKSLPRSLRIAYDFCCPLNNQIP